MNRQSFRSLFVMFTACTVLSVIAAQTAGAVEHSLLGIHIYASATTVIKKFGNPSHVLTDGQTYNTQTSSVLASMQMGGVGNAGMPAGLGQLPPMAATGGPVAAFGTAQLPQNYSPTTAGAAVGLGEVTLVYVKPNGITYEFLLSTHGTVVQITALGYGDPRTKTSKNVTFGTSYTQLLNRYGYPPNQSQSNGVTIVDYSKKDHVAFELYENHVVGIVVAAIDSDTKQTNN